jgi:hypothetical protein
VSAAVKEALVACVAKAATAFQAIVRRGPVIEKTRRG